MLTILLATLGGADAYAWATLLLVPVTGIVSWFAARKVRNNSTLQQTILIAVVLIIVAALFFWKK